MKQDQVQIFSGKFGKIISIDYYDRTDGRNHSIEDEEAIHRDLKNALLAFQDDLANAYYAVAATTREKFIPGEFIVTDSKGIFLLTIKGKFVTSHDDSVNVTSGKIPMVDDPSDDLAVKLNTLRTELWEYFWNEKADGKLPFPKGEKSKEQEEEETIAANS